MHRVAISSTGLFVPPEVITNEELVQAFNHYADLENTRHAAEIAAGSRTAVPLSSVEFIEKASGIKQRYVMEKSGILDPHRMYPRLHPRADNELSLMAELAVAAARDALSRAGKTAQDTHGLVSCAVPGARTPEQAAENAHCADVLPYLNPDDMASMGKLLASIGAM